MSENDGHETDQKKRPKCVAGPLVAFDMLSFLVTNKSIFFSPLGFDLDTTPEVIVREEGTTRTLASLRF